MSFINVIDSYYSDQVFRDQLAEVQLRRLQRVRRERQLHVPKVLLQRLDRLTNIVY